MKTINHFLNHCLKWDSLKNFSGWRSLLSFSEPLYLLAQTTRSRNLKTLAVRPIYLDGLVAFLTHLKVLVIEAWTNNRLRVGMLVGLVAVPSWYCHLLFSIDTRIEGFYYVNFAFYFNTIRPYLAGIFLATGVFIAAPQKWQFRWWALPVVVFCVTEIYAESFYTKWSDFYEIMPGWQVWIIGIFAVPALYFSLNYLAYRKYHLKDGTAARLIGIVKTPGISLEQKMDIMESLVKESENFNSRI